LQYWRSASLKGLDELRQNLVHVTNDAEIIADVKAQGANVVPSNALIAVL